MPADNSLRRLRRGLMAGACGLMVAAGVAPATAQTLDDDDGPSFEQKIIMGILGGVGVDVGNRPNIDYRERSPLVVPPSRNLPAPENAATVQQNPAWPRDPDERKRREANQRTRTTPRGIDQLEPAGGRRLSPDELRKGTVPGERTATIRSSSSENYDRERASVATQQQAAPGAPKIPSIFSKEALFGYTPEQAPFTGEPPRADLTAPPPGYRTPSPAQPYGIAEDKKGVGVKIPTLFDRGWLNN